MKSTSHLGWILVLVAVLAAALLIATRPAREPTVKGKSLNVWLRQLDHHRHFIQRTEHGDEPIPEYVNDVEALQEMGTNLFPHFAATA